MRIGFGWLNEHWVLKLISLILAIGFWFYAVGEESIEVTRNVPLEIQLSHEKLNIVEPVLKSLKVTFQAPRHFISNLSSENIVAVHRINNVQAAGDYSFTVSPGDISVSYPEVKITRIYPPM